jgi:hypothetical protein
VSVSPGFVYPSFRRDLLSGAIDLVRDDLRVLLVTGAYQPGPGHRRRSDVTGEVEGPGYEPGGQVLLGTRVEEVDGQTVFQAEDVVWPTTTVRASGLVLYKDRGGKPAEEELVCYGSFPEQESRAGEFRIWWEDGYVLILE